jgi:hypothetical protein
MKIEILRSTNCGGKHVQPGDVVEASNRDANLLVGIGFAKQYTEPQKPKSKAKRSPTNRMAETEVARDDLGE